MTPDSAVPARPAARAASLSRVAAPETATPGFVATVSAPDANAAPAPAAVGAVAASVRAQQAAGPLGGATAASARG